MLSPLLLLPLVAIVVLNLPLKNLMQRLAPWLGIALALWQVIVVFLLASGKAPASDIWTRIFTLNLHYDNLTLVLLLSIGIVIFTTILVGWQTIANTNQRFSFINLVFIAMMGIHGRIVFHSYRISTRPQRPRGSVQIPDSFGHRHDYDALGNLDTAAGFGRHVF